VFPFCSYLGSSQLSTHDGASAGHENGDSEQRLYAEHRHRESQAAKKDGADVRYFVKKEGADVRSQ